MPQPLSKVKHNSTLISINGEAFIERPHLASHVMGVLSYWAQADAHLTGMLTQFLKADYVTVTAMMQALTSSDAQNAALRAAAKQTLDLDDYNLFYAVLQSTKASRSRRNEFAHHLWGYANDLKNSLLLANPKEQAMYDAKRIEHLNKRFGLLQIDEYKKHMEEMPDPVDFNRILVYHERELIDEHANAQRAAVRILQLRLALSPTHPGREHMQNELRNQPQVQQALQKNAQKPNP